MSINDAYSIVNKEYGKGNVSFSAELSDRFVFIIVGSAERHIDPISVDKKTGKIEMFNPIVVPSEIIKEYYSKFKYDELIEI